LVQGQQFITGLVCGQVHVVKIVTQQVPAAFLTALAASVFDENAPHRLGRGGPSAVPARHPPIAHTPREPAPWPARSAPASPGPALRPPSCAARRIPK